MLSDLVKTEGPSKYCKKHTKLLKQFFDRFTPCFEIACNKGHPMMQSETLRRELPTIN